MNQLVAGFGSFVVDHLFYCEGEGERDPIYAGSVGGGTVFNVLANAARRGARTLAVGVGGDDWARALVTRDLRRADVEVVSLIGRGRTTAVFHMISTSHPLFGEYPVRSETVGRCPVCQRVPRSSAPPLPSEEALAIGQVQEAAILCFDKLTRAAVGIASAGRERGQFAVLDIGRMGHMRFMPASEVVAKLRAFQVVQTSRGVAESLCRRSGVVDCQRLAVVGPEVGLILTDGSRGLHVLDGSRSLHPGRTYGVPAPAVEVIDEVGAGDALLGHLVAVLASEGGRRWRNPPDGALADLVRAAASTTEAVLKAVGARGHLIQPEVQGTPVERFIGHRAAEIARQLDAMPSCLFCGARPTQGGSKIQRGWKPGAKDNVHRLLDRMLQAVQSPGAVTATRALLSVEGTAYVIGTGGSYPAARLIADVFNRHGRVFAQAVRPYDYIRSARSSGLVVAVSYSGGSPDIAAALSRAKDLGVQHLALITGSTRPKLMDQLRPMSPDVVVSYGRRGDGSAAAMERGFVSITGTVAPCAVVTAAAMGTKALLDLATGLFDVQEELAEPAEAAAQAVRHQALVHVLGGGSAWPTMLDVESKFVEGRLAAVQLHEVKDFSHGRFLSALDGHDRLFVVCGVKAWTPYERALLGVLRRHGQVIELRSKADGLLGGLELIMRAQIFVQKVGEHLGLDISRPRHIPKDGLRLYRYHV